MNLGGSNEAVSRMDNRRFLGFPRNPISYVNTVDFSHKTELLRTGTSIKSRNLAIWRTDRCALRRFFALHFRPAGPFSRTRISFE